MACCCYAAGTGRDGWNLELGKSSRLAEAEKPRWSPRDWWHGWVQLWCAKARRSECCNWYQFRTERCPSLPARPAWRPARLGLACLAQSRMSNKILEYSTDAQITQPWNISIWNIPQIRFERNRGMFHRCVISDTVEYSTNESVEYSIVVQNAKLWNN